MKASSTSLTGPAHELPRALALPMSTVESIQVSKDQSPSYRPQADKPGIQPRGESEVNKLTSNHENCCFP